MKDPGLYVELVKQTPRDVAQILPDFFHKMSWKTGERIVDVGCGPGNVTTQVLMPLLPADFDLLVGLDVSPQMVQYATETYTHPKLRFVECDVTKDIGNISAVWTTGFDKAFSFHCLHWVQEQREAVSNIYSLLRNGGETFIMFFGNFQIHQVYEILSQKPEWQPYMKDVRQHITPYQHSSDPAQDFKQLLQDTGFKVIACECRHLEYTFQTVRQFEDIMKSINPFIDRMPTELHEEYITDLTKEMRKLMLEQNNKHYDDDNITYGYDMIVAFAKKI